MSKKLHLKWKPVSVLLWLAVILALACILLLALWPAEEPADVDDTAETFLVRTLTVEPRDLVQSIALPGQVIPNRSVMLAAEINGVITELVVDKGAVVAAGEILARIDHRNWENQYRQAVIEDRDARRDLQRWQQMQTEGAVSQSAFDAVERRSQLAQIALEQAQIQLDKSTLRAPFDGRIDDRLLEVGAFVNEGQALFQLIENKPLKITFHVPERDVARLQPGDTLTVRAHALGPTNHFAAEVTFVGREAIPPTFTYPAELLVAQPPAALRAGMIVDVEMERAVLADALAIPLAAVIPRRGEHVVFCYREGIAERTVVWIDTMLNGEVVIKSGLEPGDQVIVAGHRTLQDGAAVEIETDQE